jgi:Ca-activated chloride channel family protein
MRAFAVIVSVIAVGAALAAAQETAGPTFKAGNRTVAVYATVTGADGRLVANLTREAFSILDNGRRQDLSLFSSDLQPITVVILLDRSGSMRGNFTLVQKAAEEFVQVMRADDKARIGSFSNGIQVDPRDFTSDKDELRNILRTELQAEGPTPLWNAVNVGITSLLHQEGRRVVLVFTDGVDRPFGSNNISYRDVEKNAEQEDVMIFAVGLKSQFGGGRRRGGPPMGGVGPSLRLPPEEPKVDAGLPKIAAATGGGYFELTSTNNLGPTFRRIADELHRQYALAFTPEKLDGKTHKLEVRIKKPNLVARARRTYIAKNDM